MMRLVQRTRRLLAIAWNMTFPKFEPRDPAAAEAERAAQSLWHDRFGPLDVMVEDADVLELGCGDGRMLAHLLASHPERARSGVGIEPQPGWIGPDGEIRWPEEERTGRLELHTDLVYLQALDLASFDLILARDLESVFPLDGLEEGLSRIYDLLRPGGEALLHVGCASPQGGAAGYGFLTPTSWIILAMRFGFEVGAVRRVWRDNDALAAAKATLPYASDEERMTAEMTLRLIRPWESWELDKVWHANPE